MRRFALRVAGCAIILFITGCTLVKTAATAPANSSVAKTTITVVDAVWFHPNASVNVKAQLASACDGKVKCEELVNDLGLPQPNSDPEVKQLSISYVCGSSGPLTVSSREYGIFRLNCADPTEPQPTFVAVLKLKLPQSPIQADGTEYLGLPPDYVECWTYTFDLNSNYASVEENRVPQLDGSVMYKLDWHLNPPLFGGNAWMDRIYMVAGERVTDASARCPPHP